MPKLTDSDKRCRKIIEILLEHPEGMKGSEIAKRLQVSSRTVRSDIKRLYELLAVHGIKISAITNRGYKLERQDVHNILTNVLPEMSHPDALSSKNERCTYIIGRFLEALLADRSVTQAELADEMYVALSSLKLYLIEVKNYLSEYFLQLVQYKNEGLRLQGDENDIRTCIVNYQREMHSSTLHSMIYSEVGSQELNVLIANVMEKCSIQLTDTAREDLCLQLALAVQRSASQHLSVCSSSVAQNLETSFEYRIAKEMVNELFKVTGRDLPYGEVFYISKCLLTSKKLKDSSPEDNFNFSTNVPDDALDKRLSTLIDDILESIKLNYGLDFANDSYLREGLLLHLRIAIAQVNFRMGMKNALLGSIKSEYPLAFQLGVLAARIVRERINVVFRENEIGYIALHFGAALSRNHIKETDVAKKIILVGSMGIGITLMLKARIKERFRNRLNIIGVIPAYKLDADTIAQVEYILSTVPLKNVEGAKVIRINNVLSDDDLERIDKVIFQESVLTAEVLRDIFDEREFFVDMEFSTREECIEFLTDKAIEHGFMSEDAKASVFERERMSSTAIGDFAAIPHALDTINTISKVSILTLTKPIMWGDLPVQAVFLLNIEQGKSQLWEEIFFKLYDYVKKYDGVSALLKHKSYKRFLSDFISHADSSI